jgi:glycosyltransferase involved in cell wall biosynthesis
MLSIVTPIHDGATNFAETVASFPTDCPSVEWIIVHDGVKSAEEIVGESVLPSNARIIAGDNQGATAAVNRGIEAAKGRFLLFLMGDDLLIARGIETLLGILEAHAEIDLVTGRVDFFQGEPGAFLDTARWPPTLDWTRLLYGRPCLGAHAMRADLFARVGGFDPGYTYCSDREFLGRALMAGVTQLGVDVPIYRYRIHRESQTMGGDASRIARYLKQHLRLATRWRDQSRARRRDAASFGDWRAYETARLVMYLLRGGAGLSAIGFALRETLREPLWLVRALRARRFARTAAKTDSLLGP